MAIRVNEVEDHATVVANLLKWHDNATEEEYAIGVTWYAMARTIAVDISAGTEYSVEQVCHVIAALSPAMDWSGKNDTIVADIVEAHSKGIDLMTLNWPVRNYDTIRKIKGILEYKGSNVLEATYLNKKGEIRPAISGTKVTSFGRNIYGNYNPITLDAWMGRVAVDNPTRLYKDSGFNSDGKGAYALVAAALTEAASLRGLTNAQFQAVVWESIRNKHTKR
jgi:hypothetical protein